MSSIMTTQEIETKALVHKSFQTASTPPDVICLAYLYIMEATNISTNTALVKSKQLQANAAEQEKLNRDMGNLTWAQLVDAQNSYIVHYRDRRTSRAGKNIHRDIHDSYKNADKKPNVGEKHTTKKVKPGLPPVFVTDRYTVVSVQTHCKNQGELDALQSKNQEVAGERELLTQKASLCQQNATIEQTDQNTTINDTIQMMQTSCQIISILHTLTFKANLVLDS